MVTFSLVCPCAAVTKYIAATSIKLNAEDRDSFITLDATGTKCQVLYFTLLHKN